MTKRIRTSSLFFTLALCFCAVISGAVSFDASAYGAENGTCGKNLTWYFDGDDTLTISGTGNMSDYDVVTRAPWYNLRKDIEEVVVNNGVKSIGSMAFLDCTEIEDVVLPASVESVKYRAFASCRDLELTVLNPYCKITDSEETLHYEAEINGYVDSTAHEYALKYVREFEPIYCNHSAGYETVVVKATPKKNGSEALRCRKCGEKQSETIIPKASNITLSETRYYYNGKVKSPTVTVRDLYGGELREGRDYTVKYLTDCKYFGEHRVQVVFKGDYDGSKVLTFKIVLNTPKNLEADQATKTLYLDWDEVKGAYGYRVYVYQGYNQVYAKNVQDNEVKVTGINPGTKYKVKVKAYRKTSGGNEYGYVTSIYTATKPTKCEFTRVTVKENGKVEFRWNLKSCTAYQLRYSENADFSDSVTVRVDNDIKFGRTVSGLEPGKTYYFKVRAYKSVEGVKYYGKFSDVEKVTLL